MSSHLLIANSIVDNPLTVRGGGYCYQVLGFLLAVWGFVWHRTFTLALTVLLNCCAGHHDNCHYLVASNKVVPLVDLTLLVLSRALTCRRQELTGGGGGGGGASKDLGASTQCGPLLKLLASTVSTLALPGRGGGGGGGGGGEVLTLQQISDAIRYFGGNSHLQAVNWLWAY